MQEKGGLGKLVKSGTISAPSGDLRLGGTVTFDCTWSSQVHDPRVLVMAFQNDAMVYAMLYVPVGGKSSGVATAILGEGSSRWVTNGGPADCQATLEDYVGAPYTKRIDRIAGPVYFSASGR
jgi:hypothetical protein